MKTNRVRAWYYLHRWSSLICALFLLMSCVTGLPLIFHDEIDNWIHPPKIATQASQSSALVSLQDLVNRTETLHPGMHPMFVTLDDDETVARVTLSRDGSGNLAQRVVASYDAHTGKNVDSDVPGQDVMDKVLSLHRDLFAGTNGELLLGFMATVLVVSLISGAVAYGPFMRKIDFGAVRWSRTNGLPWLDLHNLLGIVTLGWMLVIAGTGILNAISTPLFAAWRADNVSHLLAPYRGLPPVTQPVSVDVARAAAQRALPGRLVTGIVFPHPLYATPWHILVYTKGRTPITSRIFTPVLVDARTGGVTSSQRFPWYIHALEVSRPLHFGDYGGLPLKVLWALLDLIFIAVLISGLALWWQKRESASPARRFQAHSKANA